MKPSLRAALILLAPCLILAGLAGYQAQRSSNPIWAQSKPSELAIIRDKIDDFIAVGDSKDEVLAGLAENFDYVNEAGFAYESGHTMKGKILVTSMEFRGHKYHANFYMDEKGGLSDYDLGNRPIPPR